jgi:flavin-binding protein dodecin
MKNHVYKLIELTGTSAISIEDAIERAIQRAHKTLKHCVGSR